MVACTDLLSKPCNCNLCHQICVIKHFRDSLQFYIWLVYTWHCFGKELMHVVCESFISLTEELGVAFTFMRRYYIFWCFQLHPMALAVLKWLRAISSCTIKIPISNKMQFLSNDTKFPCDSFYDSYFIKYSLEIFFASLVPSVCTQVPKEKCQ